jgi:hypothetical protein
MNRLTKVFLLSAVSVIVFDTLGAIASRLLNFPYTSLILGSLLIYLASGFAAAKYGTIRSSFLVGAGTGFVDATVGWAISWMIGPGQPTGGEYGSGAIVLTVIFVTLLAAVSGLFGGLARRVVYRSKPT